MWSVAFIPIKENVGDLIATFTEEGEEDFVVKFSLDIGEIKDPKALGDKLKAMLAEHKSQIKKDPYAELVIAFEVELNK